MSSTQDSDSTGRTATPLEPYLIRVFDCGHPLAVTSRHALGNLDQVTLGRGELDHQRRVVDGKRTLTLALPDPRVSSVHAHLKKTLGRWVIEDAGSRNGVLRNGNKETRCVLTDGDLLELGGSFFVFRQAMPSVADATPDLVSSELTGPPGLLSLNPQLALEYKRLHDVARSSISVVIHGETGTGKELVARAVHQLSTRPGPFIAVNCGALPETLIETELFGYRKGAFSGAGEDRPGLIRSADKGTLLLDEIGDLPFSSQAAFLRVLQERQVVPIGGTKPIPVDIRLCAATHHSLQELVDEDKFRADLLSRLSGYTMRVPPLRQRREDFGILVASLLARASATNNRSAEVTFTKEAARAMLSHDWPLNVRELEKCLEAATVVAGGEPIKPEHLPESLTAPAPRRDDKAAAPATSPPNLGPEDRERREQMIALFAEHGGNISAVARAMQKERVQIRRWVQRYAIDPESFKPR